MAQVTTNTEINTINILDEAESAVDSDLFLLQRGTVTHKLKKGNLNINYDNIDPIENKTVLGNLSGQKNPPSEISIYTHQEQPYQTDPLAGKGNDNVLVTEKRVIKYLNDLVLPYGSISQIDSYTVLGNTTLVSNPPTLIEVKKYSDDDSDSDTALVTEKRVKRYTIDSIQNHIVPHNKIANIGSYRVLGNVTSGSTYPQPVEIKKYNDGASTSDTALVTEKRIKTYVNERVVPHDKIQNVAGRRVLGNKASSSGGVDELALIGNRNTEPSSYDNNGVTTEDRVHQMIDRLQPEIPPATLSIRVNNGSTVESISAGITFSKVSVGNYRITVPSKGVIPIATATVAEDYGTHGNQHEQFSDVWFITARATNYTTIIVEIVRLHAKPEISGYGDDDYEAAVFNKANVDKSFNVIITYP